MLIIEKENTNNRRYLDLMSVFEKIAFLESFFKVFEIDQQVQLHSEVEIDYLIKRINDQIKVWDNLDATHQIDVMPVFYN